MCSLHLSYHLAHVLALHIVRMLANQPSWVKVDLLMLLIAAQNVFADSSWPSNQDSTQF
jgi:hypothetical protein